MGSVWDYEDELPVRRLSQNRVVCGETTVFGRGRNASRRRLRERAEAPL
jgi:hypothetical protein